MSLQQTTTNMAYIENKKRSILKAISWRAVATIDTIIIAYFITGTFEIALSIGAIEVVTKMVIYYFHERIWNKVNYGRKKKEPEYQI